jgi:hypothetical protein
MIRLNPALMLLLALIALAGQSSLRAAEEKSLRQIIDQEVRAVWKRQKVAQAGRADDALFLRRVHLDLAGTIPTYEEAVRFLQDKDARKREKLIDKLLADPRFAAQQANVWDLVLFGRRPANPDATRNRDGFKRWLTDKFARNIPYDGWVRDLLLAEQDGSEMFYVQHRNQPEEATVAVTRIFLGTQLQCARCHDHPYENWTQRDFYGMAGFFVRLVVLDKTSGKDRRFAIAEKSTGEVLFTGAVKDRKPGQKGEPIKPKFLGGSTLEEPAVPKDFKEPDPRKSKTLPKPLFSRRAKLAAWLTAADNPYFARAAVNRVWAQFLGRGLIHPTDDLSSKNEAGHPNLFKALAQGFAEQKFDLKWLIREMVNSETYQAAATGTSKEAMPKWFERARVRPLSAEELLSAIRTATGFDASGQKTGGDTIEYFRRYFGEPTNGRGSFQGGLLEHLFLNNSDNLRRMIARRKGNLADHVLNSKEAWEKRVDRMFLSVLTRLPRTEERAKFVEYLTAEKKPDARVEESIWVLLNTAEFRFNR